MAEWNVNNAPRSTQGLRVVGMAIAQDCKDAFGVELEFDSEGHLISVRDTCTPVQLTVVTNVTCDAQGTITVTKRSIFLPPGTRVCAEAESTITCC